MVESEAVTIAWAMGPGMMVTEAVTPLRAPPAEANRVIESGYCPAVVPALNVPSGEMEPANAWALQIRSRGDIRFPIASNPSTEKVCVSAGFRVMVVGLITSLARGPGRTVICWVL